MMNHPGITGEVLGRSRAGQHNPYNWLARAVAASAQVVLDVGCGTGEMSRELHRPDRIVIALDLARDSLELAKLRSGGPCVQANALVLPFAHESFDAVTSSMGVAVITETDELLAQVVRVLKPGGVFAALLPSLRPASPADVVLAGQISITLRKLLRFPGILAVNLIAQATRAGLTTLEDAKERYQYPIRSRADAERLFGALDLEGVPTARVEAAINSLGERVLAEGVLQIAIPMRRVIFIK